MDNEKMGQFIAELRKSHQMTQKGLAEKLNVSDKAVSKWERGLSCPDISLLSPLSNILGVTTTELLNGEKTGGETVDVEAMVVNALAYSEKTTKRKIELNKSIIALAYSIFLLIGIFVVSVVDVAIAGKFTWSLIPIVSSIFAWLVFYPAIRFGLKGIAGSLISFSVFIAPFLYVLDSVIDRLTISNTMVFFMGIRLAPFAIAFIWLAYFLFKKLKSRLYLVLAILALSISPITYVIDVIIANILAKPYNGVEIILETIIPVIVAVILFAVDFIQKKERG
jgi:transcriptional regulator with XRE-family HTH domain